MSKYVGAASRFVTFNNGIKCPIVGFGTYKAYENEAYEAVKKALEIGYRHIDTAFVYANEDQVGRAINEKISDGFIKREEVFVVSKLSSANHKEEVVVPALKKSLENMNLEYLDLYLVHAPWSTKPAVEGEVCLKSATDENGKDILVDIDIVETWRGMEQCVKLGLAKSIGVSNFNRDQTLTILNNCTIKPVTNQVECHHFLNQEKLLKFSNEHDIILTAYRSLGGAKNVHLFLNDENIKRLAAKYGKTPAQIELGWLLQRGLIVIPKSSNPKRMEENFDLFDFSISDEDMDFLLTLDCNARYCEFLDVLGSKYHPFQKGVEY